MKATEDQTWQSLLALSQPTFAGETTLPYGLMTSTLARLATEKGQVDLMERIGLRALLASLVALVMAAGLAYHVQRVHHRDIDPENLACPAFFRWKMYRFLKIKIDQSQSCSFPVKSQLSLRVFS